jgi:pimeloyl-ACP methyl ester carboxylesterase
MRRDRLVCATALVAMLVLGPPPAHGQAPGPALAPCADVPVELKAQCGSITVPLDRGDPSVGTTEVRFALVPHRDSSVASEGTIVYNPGGPGEAAIAEAAEVAEQFAAVLDRRDLLLVDPRGTGRSGAIACPALENVAPLLFTPR